MCPIYPNDHPLLALAEEGRLPEELNSILKRKAALPAEHTIQHVVGQLTPPSKLPTTNHDTFNCSIYTLHNKDYREESVSVPGDLVRDSHGLRYAEGTDPAVDQCWAGLKATWEFYDTVLGRNSVDGKGLELRASIHLGKDLGDAFWDHNSDQMFFGDGGRYPGPFDEARTTHLSTYAVDVLAHEVTHGIVAQESYIGKVKNVPDVPGNAVDLTNAARPAPLKEWTTELKQKVAAFPKDQAEELLKMEPETVNTLIHRTHPWNAATINEHIADCFGMMVKHSKLNRALTDADWNIGNGWWTKETVAKAQWQGDYLRTFRNTEGIAQPDGDPKIWRPDIRYYSPFTDVHVYMGVGNHAFYQAATRFGGKYWKKLGKIWYDALRDDDFKLKKNQNYPGWRDLTIKHAKLVGDIEAQNVTDAWKIVNIV